jgi:hypothetical protein
VIERICLDTSARGVQVSPTSIWVDLHFGVVAALAAAGSAAATAQTIAAITAVRAEAFFTTGSLRKWRATVNPEGYALG